MWVLTLTFVLATIHMDQRTYPFQSREICENARAATETIWTLYGITVKTKCDYERGT